MKRKSECMQITPRWISAACVDCGRKPDGGEKVHVCDDRYYCPDHCPECSAQGQLEMAGGAA